MGSMRITRRERGAREKRKGKNMSAALVLYLFTLPASVSMRANCYVSDVEDLYSRVCPAETESEAYERGNGGHGEGTWIDYICCICFLLYISTLSLCLALPRFACVAKVLWHRRGGYLLLSLSLLEILLLGTVTISCLIRICVCTHSPSFP